MVKKKIKKMRRSFNKKRIRYVFSGSINKKKLFFFFQKHLTSYLNLVLYLQQTLTVFILNVKIFFFNLEIITANLIKLFLFLLFLKQDFLCQFNFLVDIIIKDFYTKKLRFQISYCFLNLKFSIRLIISVFTSAKIPIFSILNLYSNANWSEREIWDFFGIYILNHIDLRRLLTDYNFQQFPFRKDFPLSGFFELFYNDTKKKLFHQKFL